MDCSLPGSSVHGIFQAITGVGCHCLLQRIFPTQRLNLGLPHCRQTLYRLSHQGSKKPKTVSPPKLNLKLALRVLNPYLCMFISTDNNRMSGHCPCAWLTSTGFRRLQAPRMPPGLSSHLALAELVLAAKTKKKNLRGLGHQLLYAGIRAIGKMVKSLSTS